MLSKFVYLMLACFTVPMIADNGVDFDSGGMDLQIQFDASINDEAAEITFYNGVIRLREIEFEGEKTNGEKVEYDLAQPTTIDLTTGLASPALNPIMIPGGEYEALSLELKGAPKGSLISIEGYFTDSGQNIVPLQIDIQKSLRLVIDRENYTVDQPIGFSASFLVDPSHWFAKISQQDLQGAERDANGVVHIDPYRNLSLYRK
ncbi:MAG: hypothetical protein AAFP02_02620, partial [Bacteroidota bacterium]